MFDGLATKEIEFVGRTSSLHPSPFGASDEPDDMWVWETAISGQDI